MKYPRAGTRSRRRAVDAIGDYPEHLRALERREGVNARPPARHPGEIGKYLN
jgi:hypothetical protein